MTARGPAGRLAFLDGLRGLALIFMVVNHTARWWLGGPMSWPRYHLIYLFGPWARGGAPPRRPPSQAPRPRAPRA